MSSSRETTPSFDMARYARLSLPHPTGVKGSKSPARSTSSSKNRLSDSRAGFNVAGFELLGFERLEAIGIGGTGAPEDSDPAERDFVPDPGNHLVQHLAERGGRFKVKHLAGLGRLGDPPLDVVGKRRVARMTERDP